MMNQLLKVFMVSLIGLSVTQTSLADEVLNYQGILQLAERGDSDAQYILGAMYTQGRGVKQDYHQAVKWYQKAADQGNADAQTSLGLRYEGGQGVKQDYHQAVKWYQKAAEQGEVIAQASLGVMYENGQGVKQDKYKAKEYYGYACDNGLQKGCDEYKRLNEQGY